MTIKSQKSQRKYLLSKSKPLIVKQFSNKCLSGLGKTQITDQSQSELSFDSFFYRDHVTLKKYSYQNFKLNFASKRQYTQSSSDEKRRKLQQMQILSLIQELNLWKSIKSHRNNILVYGNKKSGKEQVQIIRENSQKKTVCEGQQSGKSMNLSKKTVKVNENALLRQIDTLKTSKHIKPTFCLKYQGKSLFPNNISCSGPSPQKFGKLKQKMNQQIYKMNKQLLRDYLKDQKQYDINYNHLIKDQDSLDSKLNKIRTLIKVLEKKQASKFTQKNVSSQCQADSNKQNYGEIQFSNICQNGQKQNQSKKQKTLKLKTQDSGIAQPMKSTRTLKKLSFKCLNANDHQTVNVLTDKICKPIRRQTRKFHLATEAIEQKVDDHFNRQWAKIDREIKIKYRREAQYSLNQFKKKCPPI